MTAKTKQELAIEIDGSSNKLSLAETQKLEQEWKDAPDARELNPSPNWHSKICICGNRVWCGRDRHRPSFAVDATNGTIEFSVDNDQLAKVRDELNALLFEGMPGIRDRYRRFHFLLGQLSVLAEDEVAHYEERARSSAANWY